MLQLMLHMSVCGVTKLHICSIYRQLVAVGTGKKYCFFTSCIF